jgi:hypothetical protein
MRNETASAALAAPAASLVIRRTSDQILQSRCESPASEPGGAQEIVPL